MIKLTNTYTRINWVEVLTAGTSFGNEGTIYVGDTNQTWTAGVPQTANEIFATVPIGVCKNQGAFYTVPNGKKAYLLSHHVGIVGDYQVYGEYVITLRRLTSVTKSLTYFAASLNTVYREFSLPLVIPGKTDLILDLTMGATTIVTADGYMELLEVDD